MSVTKALAVLRIDPEMDAHGIVQMVERAQRIAATETPAAHEHEPYDSHGSIQETIPHKHVQPANRVLRDLLVCIAEREELDEEHMSALVRYVIANEQEIWNEIIGPVIDRIADLEVEA